MGRLRLRNTGSHYLDKSFDEALGGHLEQEILIELGIQITLIEILILERYREREIER